MKFVHKISKGSRFNQIYIPRGMEDHFEIGDLVEVKLVKKKINLHYSKNLRRLNLFKERLIRDIFSFLDQFREIEQVFVVGSFLTEKVDYNDIDLLLITNEINRKFEEKIYNKLINVFSLKFHILTIQQERLISLEKICPLTRSMLYYYVSNKKFKLLSDRKINKNHIKFLLMMPEDILEINISSRIFYDNIRRLITIERFLERRNEDPKKINNELKELFEEYLFFHLKKNMEIDKNTMKKLREIIKKKLNNINNKIK